MLQAPRLNHNYIYLASSGATYKRKNWLRKQIYTATGTSYLWISNRFSYNLHNRIYNLVYGRKKSYLKCNPYQSINDGFCRFSALKRQNFSMLKLERVNANCHKAFVQFVQNYSFQVWIFNTFFVYFLSSQISKIFIFLHIDFRHLNKTSVKKSTFQQGENVEKWKFNVILLEFCTFST